MSSTADSDEIKRLIQVNTEDTYSEYNYYHVLNQALHSYPELSLIHRDLKVAKKHFEISTDTGFYLTKYSPEELAIKILFTLARISIHKPFSTLVGILNNKLKGVDGIKGAQIAAELLLLVDDLQIEIYSEHNNMRALQYIDMPADIIKLEASLQHLPPMIVRPEKTSKHSSGFLTFNKRVMLSKFSNNASMNFTGLDTLNSIRFALNLRIAASNRSLREDSKNDEYFVVLEDEAIKYMLSNDNEFYFTHNFDSRGRVYCDGYQLNYQGDDRSKALICLAKQESLWLELSVEEMEPNND